MEWVVGNLIASPSKRYPHLCIDPVLVDWKDIKQFAIAASYVFNFDCKLETPYWYIIKDTPFDIKSLKSKRRYEIKKGVNNFDVILTDKQSIIDDLEKGGGYAEELYKVQTAAFTTYPSKYRPTVSKEEFFNFLFGLKYNNHSLLFVAFEKETGRLSGYLNAYDFGNYISLSSMKVLPTAEKDNVNFALIYELVDYFRDKLESNRVYLSDGARNFYHHTNFQDFLIKYFGFRKAHAHYYITFKFPFNIAIYILYPFRNFFAKADSKYLYQLGSVLKLYEVSKQCQKIKTNR